ncbi:MAG: metallophosphoesterase family protein [Acidobacteria bacterium]|nr:metallophosphoesterase family protein [Acidobacteriota bacterium]
MRYLILSDIHSNQPALDAVLADAAGEFDQIICCGDLVGYGADPNSVVDWARGNVQAVVRGNHDKACAGLDDLEWFNPVARSSAAWTIETLRAENTAYLRELPKGPVAVNGYQILHGSPVDEDEYLVAAQEVARVRFHLQTKLSFFGHTHVQGGFLLTPTGVVRVPKTPPGQDHQVLEFEDDVSYLINPGSVGQPRDGDPRAAYVLYNSEEKWLTYHRVVYDIALAQAKIHEAQLPQMLANRLSNGA